MVTAALATAFAQSKIGSAGAGTLAERPEVGTTLIILQALPETIILLGFVIAFMLGTA
jgi:V/A-type H+-transporting ATPase subunit K